MPPILQPTGRDRWMVRSAANAGMNIITNTMVAPVQAKSACHKYALGQREFSINNRPPRKHELAAFVACPPDIRILRRLIRVEHYRPFYGVEQGPTVHNVIIFPQGGQKRLGKDRVLTADTTVANRFETT